MIGDSLVNRARKPSQVGAPLRLLGVMLFALLLPYGCVSLSPPEVSRSAVSLIDASLSGQAIVSDHPHHTALAQALILSDGTELVYAVDIGQINDRVNGRLRIDSAWQDGRPLAFNPPGRGERFCHGWDCSGFRMGEVILSQSAFQAASAEGLEATLIGPDATLLISVPASLFAQSLRQAETAGLLP